MAANDPGTIRLEADVMLGCASEMRLLAKRAGSNYIKGLSGTVFKESRGNSADTLEEYAELTFRVAKNLETLMENSHNLFKNICESFSEADETAALMITNE